MSQVNMAYRITVEKYEIVFLKDIVCSFLNSNFYSKTSSYEDL